MTRVYVALGGNIGDSEAVFHQTLETIQNLEGVERLLVSSFYVTEPVSEIPQRDYLNGVCSFETTLGIRELFDALQRIEKEIGKVPKKWSEPRVIDLDMLFYGREIYQDNDVTVPHPRWENRSFVTIPFYELLEIEENATSPCS